MKYESKMRRYGVPLQDSQDATVSNSADTNAALKDEMNKVADKNQAK